MRKNAFVAPPPSGASPETRAKFLDAERCGARYDFSPEHWRRLVDAGKAPQPTRFGRLVRWSEAALDDWDDAGNPPIRPTKPVAKGGRR